jgi:hypothetical protein
MGVLANCVEIRSFSLSNRRGVGLSEGTAVCGRGEGLDTLLSVSSHRYKVDGSLEQLGQRNARCLSFIGILGHQTTTIVV